MILIEALLNPLTAECRSLLELCLDSVLLVLFTVMLMSWMRSDYIISSQKGVDCSTVCCSMHIVAADVDVEYLWCLK